MNSALLRLKAVDKPDNAPAVRRTLDCPTRGVVMLDIDIGDKASATPLHWRAGDWTKPPLDLRLNDQGFVESIQFVFQDELVEAAEIVVPSEPELGLPMFDVDGWPEDRYLDARILVKTVRLPSGDLYAVIGESEKADQFVSVAGGLRFGFSSTAQLVGIALGPIMREDWQTIETAAP